LIEKQLQEQKEQHERQLQQLKIDYENEIHALKEQLSEFKNQLFEIAKQPKEINNHYSKNTTNNRITNIVNHLVPMNLTDEQIRKILKDKYTEEIFLNGPDGIVEVTTNHIFMDEYSGKFRTICADTARNVFYHIDDEGNLIKDIGMENFHKKIQKPLNDTTSAHFLRINQRNTINDEELGEIFRDNVNLVDDRERLINKVKNKVQIPVSIS